MSKINCPICGDNNATCDYAVESEGASWTWVTWCHDCRHCGYSAKKVTQDAYGYEDVENCQLPDHRPAQPDLMHGGLNVGHALNRDINRPTALTRQIEQLQQRLKELALFEQRAMRLGGAFLSYSHRDTTFVDQLHDRLTKDGIVVWRDVKEMLVGEVIDEAVSAGIQDNWLFIVVLTPNSVNSRWVARELDEASHEEIQGSKVLLPVVARGLDPASVPARLRRRYCAIFNDDFELSYVPLQDSIKRHLARHAASRSLQSNPDGGKNVRPGT